MKKQLFFVLLALLVSTGMYAQFGNSRMEATNDPGTELGLTAGFQGVGIQFTQKFTAKMSMRLGLTYFPDANIKGPATTVSGINFDNQVSLKNAGNFHMMLDFYPFSKSGFRITPGFGYFSSTTGEAVLTPTSNYQFNDYTVVPNQIGTATGTVTWDGAAPYLGVGYVFARNNTKKIHFFADLGTYYLPKPIAEMSGTKLLANNGINQDIFQENMKGYRWLPNLQIGVSYKF